jgi:hypothetical protein
MRNSRTRHQPCGAKQRNPLQERAALAFTQGLRGRFPRMAEQQSKGGRMRRMPAGRGLCKPGRPKPSSPLEEAFPIGCHAEKSTTSPQVFHKPEIEVISLA